MALILVFSTASLHAERINLITDQYWFEIINRERHDNPFAALQRTVSDAFPFLRTNNFFAGKKRIRTYVIDVMGDQADYKLISEAAAAVSGGIIFLSPLLSADACKLAVEYPDREFAVFGVQMERDCSAGNVRIFDFDYSVAFFEAGCWAAEQDAEVFPLFFTGTSRDTVKMDAFKDGWKHVTDEGFPEILEIVEADDTKIIDSYVNSVENSPGCIAAVFAGPLSVTALDRLEGVSSQIITENVLLWSETGYTVTASIELSPVKILSDAVTYYSDKSYEGETLIRAEFILP